MVSFAQKIPHRISFVSLCLRGYRTKPAEGTVAGSRLAPPFYLGSAGKVKRIEWKVKENGNLTRMSLVARSGLVPSSSKAFRLVC